MVWDAGKAFMREFIIQHNTQLKKKSQEKKWAILTEIKKKQEKLKISPEEITALNKLKIYINSCCC